MNSSKKQKVSDKIRIHSVTNKNNLPLPVIDYEVQLNNNSDEERFSGNLTINNLNHDCLAQVLMHLSVLDRLEMEKVCQKWQEAIEMCRYNVKKINFNDLIITLDKKEKTWKMILTKYVKYLTHITIDAKYSWIYDVMKNDCQNTIHFEVYEGTDHTRFVPYESLLETVLLMPKLKYLKIKILASNSTENPTNFFIQLMRQLPNDIDEIHLILRDFNNDGDEYPEISVTPDKFKSIRCLTLQGLRLNHTIKELISLHNKTLVYLNLSDCESPPDFSIFLNLHNLEFLDLYSIKNLDINVITTIARYCPKLSHLKWRSVNDNYSTQVVPCRYLYELKYLRNLEYLYIDEIEGSNNDESFLFDIAENCKKLKHLDTGLASSRSTLDLKEIIKFGNLEYLNLGSTVNSKWLIEISNNCLELRKLFMWLKNVDASAIEKITNLKKLENLYFFECNNLTEDLLINITSTCKNLKYIEITSCSNVTEASLIQVAKLQFLESLVIDNTVNVPIAMFNYLHRLKQLSCRDCPSVTDEGIIKVIDNCLNLSTLILYGTSVTVETLIHASKRQLIFQNLHIYISKSDEIIRFYRDAIESPYLELEIY